MDAVWSALVVFNLIMAGLCVAFMARRFNADIFVWLLALLPSRWKALPQEVCICCSPD